LKQIHQRAKATVKAMYTELAAEPDDEKRKALFKFIQKSESERSLNALVNLTRTDPRIAVSISSFDTQVHLLNCANGTIDLRTGKLLPHRREDLITKQCPVAFDPLATDEVWVRFLRECTRADADLQGFLQRAVGYTLFGDPREQVILMVKRPRWDRKKHVYRSGDDGAGRLCEDRRLYDFYQKRSCKRRTLR
jgi:putative DNA primase/helicase